MHTYSDFHNNVPDSNINLYYCGTSKCRPGHSNGPALRDHFLIHFVHSGKGIFKSNNKTYYLEGNQGFLAIPGEVFYYEADHDNPWQYSWIGVNGELVRQYLKYAGIGSSEPTFTFKQGSSLNDILKELIHLNSTPNSIIKDARLKGLTYMLFSYLIEDTEKTALQSAVTNSTNYYIEKAVDFMYKNYSTKCTVADMARHVNLERKYFCTIFKQNLKATPQQMLTDLRMRKACELLKANVLTISQVALSVGYEDVSQFSKRFKSKFGRSPGEYRIKASL